MKFCTKLASYNIYINDLIGNFLIDIIRSILHELFSSYGTKKNEKLKIDNVKSISSNLREIMCTYETKNDEKLKIICLNCSF
jgi:hypothetical protein